LALVTTCEENHWGLFRDYSRTSPHSARIGDLKKTLSRFAEFCMFESVSGKTVKLTMFAGLRKYFASPLVDQEMVFSISPTEQNITVRSDVYCGKNGVSHKKNEASPLALKVIAERVKGLHKPIDAKRIVQEVMSSTTDRRETQDIITTSVKAKWTKLPKVPPQPSLAVEPKKAANYFWEKQPDPEKVTEINPLLIVEGKEDRTMQTLEKMQTLLEDNPQPMTIKNKKMVLRDENAVTPFFQTLAGGHVRNRQNGEPVLTHEFDHRSF
jgi:hypothetical protein